MIHFAKLGITGGQMTPARDGYYFKWSPGEGVELWLQTNKKMEFLGVNPHFSSGHAETVLITAEIPCLPEHPLDGGFHAWAAPMENQPQEGVFPFIFECPDSNRMVGCLNQKLPVEIAAFAEEIRIFTPEQFSTTAEEAFIAGMKMGRKSFIPSGLFGVEKTLTQKAHALFVGETKTARLLTNPATGLRFIHLRLATLEMELDVVSDPDLVDSLPSVGDLVQVGAWFSGRVIVPDTRYYQPQPWWRRLFPFLSR